MSNAPPSLDSALTTLAASRPKEAAVASRGIDAARSAAAGDYGGAAANAAGAALAAVDPRIANAAGSAVKAGVQAAQGNYLGAAASGLTAGLQAAGVKSQAAEGALAGLATGAGAGAAIGTIVPGIGNAVGAIVGAVVGVIGGLIAGIFGDLDAAADERNMDRRKNAMAHWYGLIDAEYPKILGALGKEQQALAKKSARLAIRGWNIDQGLREIDEHLALLRRYERIFVEHYLYLEVRDPYFDHDPKALDRLYMAQAYGFFGTAPVPGTEASWESYLKNFATGGPPPPPIPTTMYLVTSGATSPTQPYEEQVRETVRLIRQHTHTLWAKPIDAVRASIQRLLAAKKSLTHAKKMLKGRAKQLFELEVSLGKLDELLAPKSLSLPPAWRRAAENARTRTKAWRESLLVSMKNVRRVSPRVGAFARASLNDPALLGSVVEKTPAVSAWLAKPASPAEREILLTIDPSAV